MVSGRDMIQVSCGRPQDWSGSVDVPRGEAHFPAFGLALSAVIRSLGPMTAEERDEQLEARSNHNV
jgi:hypothetical protein